MSDRLTIRGVDSALWRRARLVALHLDLTMGQAVNEALGAWLTSIHVPVDEGQPNGAPAARREQPGGTNP